MANMGNLDRIMRALVGLGLLWAVFVGPLAAEQWTGIRVGLLIIAVIMTATSAIRFCPIYRIFGMNTCEK